MDDSELEDTDELKESIESDFNESCEEISKVSSFNSIKKVMKEEN